MDLLGGGDSGPPQADQRGGGGDPEDPGAPQLLPKAAAPVSRFRATLQGAFGGASQRGGGLAPAPLPAGSSSSGAGEAPASPGGSTPARGSSALAPSSSSRVIAAAAAATLDLGAGLRAQHERQVALESAFTASLHTFAEKGVKKGLAPLLDAGYVGRSGPCVAHFLRLCGHEVAPDTEVGDYLGDEGRTPADAELAHVRTREEGAHAPLSLPDLHTFRRPPL